MWIWIVVWNGLKLHYILHKVCYSVHDWNIEICTHRYAFLRIVPANESSPNINSLPIIPNMDGIIMIVCLFAGNKPLGRIILFRLKQIAKCVYGSVHWSKALIYIIQSSLQRKCKMVIGQSKNLWNQILPIRDESRLIFTESESENVYSVYLQ